MLPFSLDIWNGHNAACLIGTTACRPEGTHQSESPGSQAPGRPHGASGVPVPTGTRARQRGPHGPEGNPPQPTIEVEQHNGFQLIIGPGLLANRGMQHARFKPHAGSAHTYAWERTCNLVQRPGSRGDASFSRTLEPTPRCPRRSLHPHGKEHAAVYAPENPLRRAPTRVPMTSLGDGLFGVQTGPVTGEPFPRSSSSFIRTRWLHLIYFFFFFVFVHASSTRSDSIDRRLSGAQANFVAGQTRSPRRSSWHRRPKFGGRLLGKVCRAWPPGLVLLRAFRHSCPARRARACSGRNQRWFAIVDCFIIIILYYYFITAGMVVERKPCVRGR